MIRLKIGMNFFEFLICLYYTWAFLPIAGAVLSASIFKYIFTFCFLTGTAGLLLFKSKRDGIELNAFSIQIFIYLFFVVAIALLDLQQASRNLRSAVVFFMTPLLQICILDNNSKKRIGKYLLFLFTATILTSSIGVIIDNNAARMITYAKNSDEIHSYYKMRNIAGVYLFQDIALLLPCVIGASIIKNKKREAFILIILMLFVLTKASFVISLGATLFAIILSLFFSVKNVNRKAFVLLFGVCLLLLIFYFRLEILMWLSKVITNEKFKERINGLIWLLADGSSFGDVSMRLDAYFMSIRTFLSHPFGAGAYYSYEIGEYGIGYHSMIFDDMARFGIFAVFYYFAFFINYYKWLKAEWSKCNLKWVAFVVTVTYAFLLTVNIGFRSAEEGIATMFIIPTLPNIIAKESFSSNKNTIKLRIR